MRRYAIFPKEAGAFPYIYLIQLLIPAFFLTTLPTQKVVSGAVLLLVFAISYILSYRSRQMLVRAIIVQSAITAIAIAYLDIGYLWLTIYPIAAIASTQSHKGMLKGFALVCLPILIELFWLLYVTHQAWSEILPYGVLSIFIVVMAVVSIRSAIRQQQTTRALTSANREIERLTRLAERDRISQDLHDVLGHELAMISLKGQLAARLVPRDPARAITEIRRRHLRWVFAKP